ncbi:MAG: VWA domain-containing protein, partial [Planctomycetota bacterium]
MDRNDEFKIEFDSLPPGVHKIRTELTSPNSSSSQPDQSRRIIIPRLYHSFTGTDYGWTFDTTANVESDWTLSSDEISNEFVRAKFGRPILDIYYVVDTSISMSITLPTFYKALGIHLTNESGLLDRIVSGSDQPRLQLGLITYHDTDGDDVDPVLNQKYFGTDLTEFQKQFRNIRFSPGGDWPEHHYDALAFANNLMRVNRSWAQNPMKIAILVTDGPARVDRVSLQEISDSLRQNNVELITVMLHPLSSPTDWIDFSSDYNWKANRTNPEFSEDEYDQKFRTRLVAVGDSDERFAFQQGILDAKRLARATDGSFFRFRDEKFQPIKQRMMAAQQMGLGLYQDIVGPKIE